MSEEPKFQRCQLDPVKKMLLKEADRAQAATAAYIEQLMFRKADIKKAIDRLSKKIDDLTSQADALETEARRAEKNAEDKYSQMFNSIVASFNIEPPYSARIVNHDGEPIAIDVEPKTSETEATQ